MGAFNWADRFEKLKELTREDILKQVRKTEIVYWVSLVIFVILIIVGVWKIFQPSAGSFPSHPDSHTADRAALP